MASPERELQLEFLLNHLPPIHFQILEILIMVLHKLVSSYLTLSMNSLILNSYFVDRIKIKKHKTKLKDVVPIFAPCLLNSNDSNVLFYNLICEIIIDSFETIFDGDGLDKDYM